MFPVSKFFSSDITWQRPAVALLKLCQDVVGPLRRTFPDMLPWRGGDMLAGCPLGDELLGHGQLDGGRSKSSNTRSAPTCRRKTEEKKQPDRPETLHHATVWMSCRLKRQTV